MTALHLLALAGYFIVLFEFIAMRHRVICAESDARINELFEPSIGPRSYASLLESMHEMNKPLLVAKLVSLAQNAIKKKEPEMTMLSKEDVVQHPTQPLVTDHHGVVRFKENKIVSFLAEGRLNELACMDFSNEDHEQLAQLIGYSLSGFGSLSYVSDETFERAQARADLVAENERLKARLEVADHGWDGISCRDETIKLQDSSIKELRTALAAAELREIKLREFVKNSTEYRCGHPLYEHALAQPRDDSALREMIAGVYEECAKVCEDDAKGWTDYSCEMAARDCADAIRALAEKAKA